MRIGGPDVQNLRAVENRVCGACSIEFTPKIGGYNARYCSKACKRRRRPRKPYDPDARTEYYHGVIKKNPKQLKAHIDAAKRSQKKIRTWLAEYKVARGCIDCGYNQFAAALQLDHTGKKTASISEIRTSIKRMLAEIKAGECVVRCANCHAVKTWREKQKQGASPQTVEVS